MYAWARGKKDGRVWLLPVGYGETPESTDSDRGTIARCKQFVWYAVIQGEVVHGGASDTLLEACEGLRKMFLDRGVDCKEVPAWAHTYKMRPNKTNKILSVTTRLSDGIVALSVNGREASVDIEREQITSGQQLAHLLVDRLGCMEEQGVHFRFVSDITFQILCMDGLDVSDNSVCNVDSLRIAMNPRANEALSRADRRNDSDSIEPVE